jgi:hypothetical protein
MIKINKKEASKNVAKKMVDVTTETNPAVKNSAVTQKTTGATAPQLNTCSTGRKN